MKCKPNRQKDWYWLSGFLIAGTVSVLIHLPELTDLTRTGEAPRIFPDIRFREVVNEIFFSFVSLLVLFGVTTRIFRFNKERKPIGIGKIALSFVLCLVLSNLLSNGFYFFQTSLGLPLVQATFHKYLHPIRDCIHACVITGSCVIIYLIRKQQRIALENEALRSENLQCQFNSLKDQLNPHMLFNSLNTLQSLIRESSSKALKYTQELSNTLRYTLRDGAEKSVYLKDEMDFVRSYLYLLEMRYEENLSFEIHIDEAYMHYLLPPMSVQLLVENAVKHNEISNRRPLRISIYATSENQLVVRNPIQPKLGVPACTGIGLSNLSKRYALLYGAEIEISKEEGFFYVKVPLIRQYPSNS